MKGASFYLITLNGKCSKEKAEEIKESGMVVYVKNKLKKQKHLRDKPWIRPLSGLPKDIKIVLPK